MFVRVQLREVGVIQGRMMPSSITDKRGERVNVSFGYVSKLIHPKKCLGPPVVPWGERVNVSFGCVSKLIHPKNCLGPPVVPWGERVNVSFG